MQTIKLQPIIKLLFWFIIAYGICSYGYYVFRESVNMPEFIDDVYEYVETYIRFENANTFKEKVKAFFAPTNKHSSADSHLVEWIMLKMIGEVDVTIMLAIGHFFSIITLLLYWRAMPQDGLVKLGLFASLVLCFTCTANFENFLWSTAALNGGIMVFFSILACYILTRSTFNLYYLIASILSFACAYFSFSTAVILIPVGATILMYRKKYWQSAIWFVLCTGIFAFYYNSFGFFGKEYSNEINFQFKKFVTYSLTIIGGWSQKVGYGSWAIYISILELLLLLFLTLTRYYKRNIFLFSILLFMLGGCLLASYGRSGNSDISTAFRPSFLVYSLPFLVFLIIAHLDNIFSRLPVGNTKELIFRLSIPFLLILSFVFHFKVNEGSLSIINGYYKKNYIESIYEYEQSGTQMLHSSIDYSMLYRIMKVNAKRAICKPSIAKYISKLVSPRLESLPIPNDKFAVLVESTEGLVAPEVDYIRISGRFLIPTLSNLAQARPYLVFKKGNEHYWVDVYTLAHRSTQRSTFETFNSNFETGDFIAIVPKAILPTGIYHVGMAVEIEDRIYFNWTSVFVPINVYPQLQTHVSKTFDSSAIHIQRDGMQIRLDRAAIVNNRLQVVFTFKNQRSDVAKSEKFGIVVRNNDQQKFYSGVPLFAPRELYFGQKIPSERFIYASILLDSLPGFDLGCQSRLTLGVWREVSNNSIGITFLGDLGLPHFESIVLPESAPTLTPWLDYKGIENNSAIKLSGWTYTNHLSDEQFSTYHIFFQKADDQNRKVVSVQSERYNRVDVFLNQKIAESALSGFEVTFPLNILNPGKYKVGVAIKRGDNFIAWGYCQSDPMLVLPSQVSQPYIEKNQAVPTLTIPNITICSK